MSARQLIATAFAGLLIAPMSGALETKEKTMPTMEEVVPAEFDYFWIVFLETGETPPDETPDTAEKRQIEHLVFLRDLARKRLSIAAGPFTERPVNDDGALRGIILLRGDLRREEVESLLVRDPHVSSGAIKTRVMKWFTAKGSLSWPEESPW